MKQARLSFGKRKVSLTVANEVVTIEDSPEKPPAKKLCLDGNKDTPNKMIPAPLKVVDDNKPKKTQNDSDSKTTPEKKRAESPKRTTPKLKLTADNENIESKDNDEPEADNEAVVVDDSDEDSEIDLSMNETDTSQLDVSAVDSSVLNSTMDSTAEETENSQDESSSQVPSTSSGKKSLSKTEKAYQQLKRRKDRELRKKEKEEKLKRREEEIKEKEERRQRREKEKKEAKEKRAQEKLEKEKKREVEKQQKEKERLEKEKKKEEERLEREKEKEEKEKLRKEKEEEKKKKEEEKRREVEEEAAKKEKAKAAFMSFFAKKTSTKNGAEVETGQTTGLIAEENSIEGTVVKFKPFQLKKNQRLAPIIPEAAKNRFDKEAMEECLQRSPSETYLEKLKHGYIPLRFKKTNKLETDAEDDDVVVVFPKSDDSSGGKMRAKLLQFVENYRPAYYGTWRKTCSGITGRRPFSKYADFDYNVDSDDEWEENEEGESLNGTDDEKEKEETEEDYEEDDFLVPHGYLSESEEEEDNDDQPMDPEALKARIAARQEEFKNDRKAGLQKKKIVAVCSIGPDGTSLQEEFKVLSQFKAVLLAATGQKPTWEREPELVISSKDAEPAVLTDEALKVFCELAHGFEDGLRQLYEQFYNQWKQLSDVKIPSKSLKLTLNHCCKKSKKLNNALVVIPELAEKFNLKKIEEEAASEDLNTPNSLKTLPDNVIPDLITVAQGKAKTSQIVEDFMNSQSSRKFGKAQVKRALKSIGDFDHVMSCWIVREDVLKQHGLEDLKVERPNVAKKDSKDKTPATPKEKSANNVSKKEPRTPTTQKKPVEEPMDVSESTESTPKSMSIKKFFTPKPKSSTPTSSNMTSITPTGTPETPKAKKRVQLTTISRTPTLKQDNSQIKPVLDEEEVMVIEDDEDE